MKLTQIDNFQTFKEYYERSHKQDVTNSQEQSTSHIVLFVASDDPNTKESWCPDCVKSKPIIEKVIEDFKFNDMLELATVKVGGRDEWNSSDNPYRSHDLHVSKVPTLVSLKTVSMIQYSRLYMNVIQNPLTCFV